MTDKERFENAFADLLFNDFFYVSDDNILRIVRKVLKSFRKLKERRK